MSLLIAILCVVWMGYLSANAGFATDTWQFWLISVPAAMVIGLLAAR